MSQILAMTKKKTVGSFMAEYRASRGVSQRALAAQIDTTGPYIAQIESNKFIFPLAIIKRFMLLLTIEEKQELFEILVESLKEECGI